jgi:hypothetical protein
MNGGNPHSDIYAIRAQIEKSSLGEPTAKKARAQVTDSTARKLVQRAASYPTVLRDRPVGDDRAGRT